MFQTRRWSCVLFAPVFFFSICSHGQSPFALLHSQALFSCTVRLRSLVQSRFALLYSYALLSCTVTLANQNLSPHKTLRFLWNKVYIINKLHAHKITFRFTISLKKSNYKKILTLFFNFITSLNKQSVFSFRKWQIFMLYFIVIFLKNAMKKE